MWTKLKYWLSGAIFGTIVTIGFYAIQPQTPEEMQQEYDGYRMCMQMASKVQCQMTPRDFVNYYDLKYALEALGQEQEQENNDEC